MTPQSLIEVFTSILKKLEAASINILHFDSGLKVDFVIRKKDAHATTEFSRRQKIPFFGSLSVFVAAPEDVIIKKLLYYKEGLSEKHLTDIRGILANWSVEEAYIVKWATTLGLMQYWKKAKEN